MLFKRFEVFCCCLFVLITEAFCYNQTGNLFFIDYYASKTAGEENWPTSIFLQYRDVFSVMGKIKCFIFFFV